MPVNLELKTKLKGHIKVQKILNSIGAEYEGILNQKDVYYSVPIGLLKLRIENGGESLIYYNRDEKGKDRWSDYDYLLFSGSGAEKMFNKIFEVETIVQKKRQLFLYDNTRIHLDTVKKLGKYLELETLVIKGKSDAQKRFKHIMDLLELKDLPEIRKSYRDLMIENKNI